MAACLAMQSEAKQGSVPVSGSVSVDVCSVHGMSRNAWRSACLEHVGSSGLLPLPSGTLHWVGESTVEYSQGTLQWVE